MLCQNAWNQIVNVWSSWCEALSSDFGFRGALRVVLDRGFKFGNLRHPNEKSEDSAYSNCCRKNIHFLLTAKLWFQKVWTHMNCKMLGNKLWKSDCHGAKHSPLSSGSGAPSGLFWIEVSNFGISDTRMRNLKALYIQMAVGKIYIFRWRPKFDFRKYEITWVAKCLEPNCECLIVLATGFGRKSEESASHPISLWRLEEWVPQVFFPRRISLTTMLL